MTNSLPNSIATAFGNRWNAESKGMAKQLLSSFHTACAALGIEYCLTYGSLLGAVRHQGAIPWDDDLDVVVADCHIQQLIQYVTKEFSGVLDWHPWWGGIKLFPVDGISIPGYGWNWPFLDVFRGFVKGESLITFDGPASWVEFPADWYFPTKKLPFWDLEVAVPSQDRAMLDRLYPQWEMECVSSSYDHRCEKVIRGVECAPVALLRSLGYL
jgi:lipopolysaccharide cholinephosphotransferase